MSETELSETWKCTGCTEVVFPKNAYKIKIPTDKETVAWRLYTYCPECTPIEMVNDE